MCTYTLLAILPSLLTMGAVCLTILVMALLATRTTQDASGYPDVDWLALDAELDVDAAWEAVYVVAMGCNRSPRCRRQARRIPHVRIMSETRVHVRRCRPCTRRARELSCTGRARESRGPPPHPGARAGGGVNSRKQSDFVTA